MFEREINLIGEENFDKLKNSNILLIGLGGVGGYVLEGLVRSGIKNFTIVDCDVVEKSNINRQIIALNSTVGESKCNAAKKRCLDINPDVQINTINKCLTTDNLSDLNLGIYDFIVDAIDDVRVKIALIKMSLEKRYNLISSMGTANKLHPEYLEITSLDKTTYDPLARKIRHNLKGYNLSKVKVLASKEKPIYREEKLLGTCSFVPSIAGLLIAGYVVNEIIN